MWEQCMEDGVATLGCIPVIIQNLISAALAFSGLVALVLFIYAGATYITSKGDPTKVENAKKTMTYAILGLILIFLSFFIIRLISTLTGVDQIANPTLDIAP